jgi:DNA-binding XRE family transcriptional regulator
MARHPRPENENHPLKKLRQALSPDGIDPITQQELARILELSPETIRSFEAGRRRPGELSHVVKTKAFVNAGAMWSQKGEEWLSNFTGQPYSREHYLAWRKPLRNREQEIHALCLKLLVLLQSTGDRDFQAVCDHVESFLDDSCQAFAIKIRDPDFKAAAWIGVPVDKSGAAVGDGHGIAGYRRAREGLFGDWREDKEKLFDFTRKLPSRRKEFLA